VIYLLSKVTREGAGRRKNLFSEKRGFSKQKWGGRAGRGAEELDVKKGRGGQGGGGGGKKSCFSKKKNGGLLGGSDDSKGTYLIKKPRREKGRPQEKKKRNLGKTLGHQGRRRQAEASRLHKR